MDRTFNLDHNIWPRLAEYAAVILTDSKLEMMTCLAFKGPLAFVHGSLGWIINCHEVHACFAAAHEACPCLPSDG